MLQCISVTWMDIVVWVFKKIYNIISLFVQHTHTHTRNETSMDCSYKPSHDDKFLSSCLCIQNITLPSIYVFFFSLTIHIFLQYGFWCTFDQVMIFWNCVQKEYEVRQFEIFMWDMSRAISLMGEKNNTACRKK